MNKKYLSVAAIISAILGLTVALVPVFADNSQSSGQDTGTGFGFGQILGGHVGKMKPVVSGNVTAISGNTITVVSTPKSEESDNNNGNTAVSVTYTVDATNAKIMKAGVAGTISSIVVGDTVFAQGTLSGTNLSATIIYDGAFHGKMGKGMMGNHPIVGTVSAVSGNTITITSKQKNESDNENNATTTPNPTTVTYTVDATNAKIIKNNAVATVSSIAVGDTVLVQGTLNGTTITAVLIRDGVMKTGEDNQGLPNLGNGQPIVAGSVTSITGNTIVITNASNVQYTVDASTAKIEKGKTLGTISDVSVGDKIIVQGAVSGTSVTASTVFDQSGAVASGDNGNNQGGGHRGFFGKIGAFFGHLFGF